MARRDPATDEAVFAAIASRLRGMREGVDSHVAANMMKVMALAWENRARLHADALAENLALMREQLLDYLFGRG